ncbi:MAG: hypothetical protein KKE39_00765 [Bacteroidetes bacterium]|nr:hypothetical protein [Bacteroidota bacterium]MBU1372756.1 hypothetical protein [Bacteroidota bacterium]MBU1484952.1 hypothetical protein [Bacteroidota bacterium]MBU1761344.1 hypothetical protein [Bacteroidota bacterium]MBU2267111.1 hypothetical protein [Bacteroidota bacterium]
MKNLIKIYLPIFVFLGIISLVVFAIIPQKASPENSEMKQGIVSYVNENGLKDITISLQGVRGIFYIGEGLKKDLSVDALRQALVGNKVTLYITKPSFFTKFSPMTSTLGIHEVILNGKVLYSDFEE